MLRERLLGGIILLLTFIGLSVVILPLAFSVMHPLVVEGWHIIAIIGVAIPIMSPVLITLTYLFEIPIVAGVVLLVGGNTNE